MADHTWFNAPAGSTLDVSTSGTDVYLADGAVHYDARPGTAASADFTIAQTQLDPGPASVPTLDTGTVSVTIGVKFIKSATVTVTATVKDSGGAAFGGTFTKPFSGNPGDGKQTCVLMVRGAGA